MFRITVLVAALTASALVPSLASADLYLFSIIDAPKGANDISISIQGNIQVNTLKQYIPSTSIGGTSDFTGSASNVNNSGVSVIHDTFSPPRTGALTLSLLLTFQGDAGLRVNGGEWSFPDGSTTDFNVDRTSLRNLTVNPAPGPAAAIPMALGMIGMARRRRQR